MTSSTSNVQRPVRPRAPGLHLAALGLGLLSTGAVLLDYVDSSSPRIDVLVHLGLVGAFATLLLAAAALMVDRSRWALMSVAALLVALPPVALVAYVVVAVLTW